MVSYSDSGVNWNLIKKVHFLIKMLKKNFVLPTGPAQAASRLGKTPYLADVFNEKSAAATAPLPVRAAARILNEPLPLVACRCRPSRRIPPTGRKAGLTDANEFTTQTAAAMRKSRARAR